MSASDRQTMSKMPFQAGDQLRLIRRRFKVLLSITILVSSIVLLVTLFTPLTFSASIRLIVNDDKAKQLDLGQFVTSVNREFCYTQAEIVKSAPVARRVVEKLSLVGRTKPQSPVGWILNGIKQIPRRVLDLLRSPSPLPADQLKLEAATRDLLDHVSVQLVRNTTVLVVTVEDFDQALVPRLAEAFGEAYIERTRELRRADSHQASESLLQRLAEVQSKLVESERALRIFEDENQAAHVDIQIKHLVEVRSLNLENDLGTVEKSLAEEKARCELTAGQLQQQYQKLLSGQQAGLISQLKLRLGQKQAELSGLLVSYTPHDSQVEGVQREINAIEAQIASEQTLQHTGQAQAADRVTETLEEALHSAKQTVHAMSSRRAEILRQREAVKALLKQLLEKNSRHAILQREVETNRKIYDALLMRQKEVALMEATISSAACILEQASYPTQAIRPRRSMNALVGLVLGFALGFLAIHLLERYDDVVRTADEVVELSGLRLLGMIPRKSEFVPTDGAPELIAAARPNSVMAESFRGIRISMRHTPFKLTPFGEGQRLVLITSSQPGEGKTTVASNLAISVAQAGSRVLLIDCDLRRPSIGRIHDLGERPGLSALATAEAGELIVETPHPNLWVLPAGEPPGDPSSFLDSMRDRIAALSANYDVVFLDCPPVNAVNDALILMPVAGTVLFVVSLGETARPVFLSALDKLKAVGVQPGGLILNNVESGLLYGYGYQAAAADGGRVTQPPA